MLFYRYKGLISILTSVIYNYQNGPYCLFLIIIFHIVKSLWLQFYFLLPSSGNYT